MGENGEFIAIIMGYRMMAFEYEACAYKQVRVELVAVGGGDAVIDYRSFAVNTLIERKVDVCIYESTISFGGFLQQKTDIKERSIYFFIAGQVSDYLLKFNADFYRGKCFPM